jgi:hypothetical protein
MLIYGVLMIPAQSLLAQFILYSNFTLVRHWTDLGLTVQVIIILTFSFAIFTFWCVILEISGRFYVNSITLLKRWKMLEFKSKGEAKFMSFIKGCRPLSIGLQLYMKVKRLSVPKLQGIVGGTFRALLSL